ncbi:acetyl-CoA synthetase [Acetitomaculum ruminis DSM 5522]|uniref:Acetyl-CoA synthetase n=1 Tax=Acetitomaculum ruminis DSM 5522 TaxID=1120918 RepID=A0A1I0ZNE8_9FIRM|nr:AMP-binding protein [Acetitomaculum ruminis]SFB27017.1 acetyl-CoA synthetase [Acetitomaculum ruminis DSM 5522]
MSLIYEEYYKEIKDNKGQIVKIETDFGENFNFAYDVVDRFAKESPDKTALIHKSADNEEKRFTFKDLKIYSDKEANVLKKLGIEKKDSVLLLLKRRVEFWICILALHKLGAVAIPTSHMVSAKDISERIKVSKAKAIICVNSEHICKKVEEATKGIDIKPIVVGEKYQGMLSYEELFNQADENFTRVLTNVKDDMLYYFTSGTNGDPKAVIHDYSYPLAHIYTAKNWHGMKDGDLHLTVADSGWAKSAWGKLYGQWFLGASIMVYDYEQFYATDMLKLLEEEKINTFCAPPTIYKYLLLEDIKKYDLSNLRQVTTAGEAMPKEISLKFEEITGLKIREGFGQTETALQICTPVGEEGKEGSIGKINPLYNIKLVDEEGQEVLDNEEGEIVIIPQKESDKLGIFKGYLGDDTEYKSVWENGIYHTKDRAKKDEEGYFYFLGRNDDVIKSSGYRIGPSEVEDILMTHPAVFECAITAYPSKSRGFIVKASVVLNEGYKGDNALKNTLQDFTKERIALYKYPRKIEFLDALPHTNNGKINRSKIRMKDYENFQKKLLTN